MKKSFFHSLMIVMGVMSSMERRTEYRTSEPPRSQLTKIKNKVREINLSNGASEWSYPDGFKCIARNQANADRKHRNWLNATK